MAERVFTVTESDLRGMKEGDAFRLYLIKRGDTMYALSKEAGVSVDTLARINGIKDSAHIMSGDMLLLPVRPRRNAKAGGRKSAPGVPRRAAVPFCANAQLGSTSISLYRFSVL